MHPMRFVVIVYTLRIRSGVQVDASNAPAIVDPPALRGASFPSCGLFGGAPAYRCTHPTLRLSWTLLLYTTAKTKQTAKTVQVARHLGKPWPVGLLANRSPTIMRSYIKVPIGKVSYDPNTTSGPDGEYTVKYSAHTDVMYASLTDFPVSTRGSLRALAPCITSDDLRVLGMAEIESDAEEFDLSSFYVEYDHLCEGCVCFMRVGDVDHVFCLADVWGCHFFC